MSRERDLHQYNKNWLEMGIPDFLEFVCVDKKSISTIEIRILDLCKEYKQHFRCCIFQGHTEVILSCKL